MLGYLFRACEVVGTDGPVRGGRCMYFDRGNYRGLVNAAGNPILGDEIDGEIFPKTSREFRSGVPPDGRAGLLS